MRICILRLASIGLFLMIRSFIALLSLILLSYELDKHVPYTSIPTRVCSPLWNQLSFANMTAFWIYITLGILVLVSVSDAGGTSGTASLHGVYNYTIEKELRSRLLDSSVYDPVTRPEDVVKVYASLHLLSIEKLDIGAQEMTVTGYLEVDIASQQMTVTGYLEVEWYDYRITWNHTEYGDMQYIFAKQTEIWFPELIIDNSIAGFNVIYNKELKFRIKSNGLIFWEPPLIFYTHCEVDITYYPFDQQKCGVDMASWGYHDDEVTLEHLYDHVITEDYKENGEWILTDTNTEFHHLADTVGGVTHYFPQLDFNLFIRRRPAFYILNRILPVILSSFLVIVVFILPCESGEKVSYALTELLALAFLLTLITDYMPSTSLTISILGLYLAFTLFLSTFATLATVFILWFHLRGGDMENDTCFARTTKFVAKTIGWNQGSKTTKIQRISSPDIADGHVGVHVEEEEIYSWREVSLIWDKACLWFFLFVTIISTIAFMTALSIGGEVQGVR